MPRSKARFEELRNHRIELIERSALKCFAANGFHNTSISTIAKEAGMSMGLTYNYFSSKDELLKSIYVKGLQKVYAPLKEDTALTKETLKGFIEHIFREIETNVPFWRLYFIVMSQPEILNQFQEYMIETATPIITAIVHYFGSRNLPNPGIEAQFLFSTIDGVCINYLISNKQYPLAQMKQKIINNYE